MQPDIEELRRNWSDPWSHGVGLLRFHWLSPENEPKRIAKTEKQVTDM
jgi:hypothetical protein